MIFDGHCPNCLRICPVNALIVAVPGVRCRACEHEPQSIDEAVRDELLKREREVIDGARWVP